MIANGKLQKFRLGLVASRGEELPAGWASTIALGEAIQTPQLNNRKDAVCLVLRAELGWLQGGVDGHTQGGIPLASASWESYRLSHGHPAGQWAILLAAKDGGLFEIPAATVSVRGNVPPVASIIAPPPENVTSATSVAVSADGKTIFTIAQVLVNEDLKQVPKHLIRRIAGGKVVHEGTVNTPTLSNGTPASLAGSPAILGDLLVVPLADGYVYRHTSQEWGEGKPDTLVIGPSWSGDQRIEPSTRCYITPLTDVAFLTSDGSKKISRWDWPLDDRWNPTGDWELRDQPTGPGLLIPTAGGASPPRLLLADMGGTVWLYSDGLGGQTLRRWRPGANGIPVGRPSSPLVKQVNANGKTVVAYTVEDKYLVCLDPERDDRWSVRTGDDPDAATLGG